MSELEINVLLDKWQPEPDSDSDSEEDLEDDYAMNWLLHGIVYADAREAAKLSEADEQAYQEILQDIKMLFQEEEVSFIWPETYWPKTSLKPQCNLPCDESSEGDEDTDEWNELNGWMEDEDFNVGEAEWEVSSRARLWEERRLRYAESLIQEQAESLIQEQAYQEILEDIKMLFQEEEVPLGTAMPNWEPHPDDPLRWSDLDESDDSDEEDPWTSGAKAWAWARRNDAEN